MLKSHGKFHSMNGKRMVLIADDESINREILASALESDYELRYAADGSEALDVMRANRDELSLVLLDLLMPVMNGLEVLKQAKSDPTIAHVPIIVTTSDQDAEVECLTLGASDFIPKPYPRPGVMLARILKTIELTEGRQIISSTERDTLTGLYNRDYFYRYAEQYDQHHKDTDMDAIVVDVNHFHMINERFGSARGDDVLRRISEALREEVAGVEGIVCRREADIFLVYCPHGLDYNAILENTTEKVSGKDGADTLVWLRMGVYENVDKTLDIERCFDRAKIAADTVQGSFASRIGKYDASLHEKELYHEQLIEDFKAAIGEGQFQVYYQPKFDILTEIPVLASAEALVRWAHPTLGMISPGVFIPLFEDNGLIQSLDTYVWRETAAHIREWRDRFDFVVPVSVNVSRVDMYDPHLVETLLGILDENGLTPHEFLLEITESAYTENSEQIIETVNQLRQLGFKVEMDDFGTGYSSLNMISTLPIDALKMDMQFIRNAFNEGGDTKMLEVIIDIADHLSIPVIAEGVETKEQLDTLKDMGCEIVQGYYFSKPVPATEYEQFVLDRKDIGAVKKPDEPNRSSEQELFAFEGITHALSSGFESIFYIDTDTDHYIEFNSHGRRNDLQIEHDGHNFFGDAVHRAVGPVCEEDRDRVSASLDKETLLSQLADATPFTMTFRTLENGALSFYNLEAVSARTHDNHHVILGISNIDSQLADAEALKGRHAENILRTRIAQALACEYRTLYHVDLESGRFVKYVALANQEGLGIQTSGGDFFGHLGETVARSAHPDDRAAACEALAHESLLPQLMRDRTFDLAYRTLPEGATSTQLTATLLAGTQGGQLVIGFNDADSASI